MRSNITAFSAAMAKAHSGDVAEAIKELTLLLNIEIASGNSAPTKRIARTISVLFEQLGDNRAAASILESLSSQVSLDAIDYFALFRLTDHDQKLKELYKQECRRVARETGNNDVLELLSDPGSGTA